MMTIAAFEAALNAIAITHADAFTHAFVWSYNHGIVSVYEMVPISWSDDNEEFECESLDGRFWASPIAYEVDIATAFAKLEAEAIRLRAFNKKMRADIARIFDEN